MASSIAVSHSTERTFTLLRKGSKYKLNILTSQVSCVTVPDILSLLLFLILFNFKGTQEHASWWASLPPEILYQPRSGATWTEPIQIHLKNYAASMPGVAPLSKQNSFTHVILTISVFKLAEKCLEFLVCFDVPLHTSAYYYLGCIRLYLLHSILVLYL